MGEVSGMSTPVLIDAAELAAELGIPSGHSPLGAGESSRAPVVVDVRWRLDRPDGSADHAEAHIPGAVYASLDDELAEHGAPTDGRHPLPSRERLQAAARRWGVREGSSVVVADDLNGMSAARAWWLLRAAGLTDVRILDGGLAAWRAAGLPLESGAVVPEPGDVVLGALDALPTVGIDEVAAVAEAGVLIDARAGERYRGETEPIDPRAGHIPGAVNRPTTQNVVPGVGFAPASQLRAEFEALGVRDGVPVAVYCGSGVTASHEIAALAIAGFDAALYPGSWSQWSNHPDRPAATGP